MDWCKLYPEIRRSIFHIANEAKRGWVEGKKIKKIGGEKGVLDYFFMEAHGEYHGLWIEMKRPGGKLTVNQKAFIRRATENGYKCVVVYSWVEARDELENYLKLGD